MNKNKLVNGIAIIISFLSMAVTLVFLLSNVFFVDSTIQLTKIVAEWVFAAIMLVMIALALLRATGIINNSTAKLFCVGFPGMSAIISLLTIILNQINPEDIRINFTRSIFAFILSAIFTIIAVFGYNAISRLRELFKKEPAEPNSAPVENKETTMTLLEEEMFTKARELLNKLHVGKFTRITNSEISAESFFGDEGSAVDINGTSTGKHVIEGLEHLKDPIQREQYAKYRSKLFETHRADLNIPMAKAARTKIQTKEIVNMHYIEINEAHSLLASFKFGIMAQSRLVSVAELPEDYVASKDFEGTMSKHCYIFENDFFKALKRLMAQRVPSSLYNIENALEEAGDDDEEGDAFA